MCLGKERAGESSLGDSSANSRWDVCLALLMADFWLLELVEERGNHRWAPSGCLQRAVLCKSCTFGLEAHQVDKRKHGQGDAPILLSKGINMGVPCAESHWE